ncbi:MAG: hypothetical protein NWE98_04200 [Candidatus Bathyarchaeota archaeon]|nr:hypothetical protein [Candidatus Bathyarchaeota archaeon]
MMNQPEIKVARTKDPFEIAQIRDNYLVDPEQVFLRLVLFPANVFCGFTVAAKDATDRIIG